MGYQAYQCEVHSFSDELEGFVEEREEENWTEKVTSYGIESERVQDSFLPRGHGCME
jgi:hypothetical protein